MRWSNIFLPQSSTLDIWSGRKACSRSCAKTTAWSGWSTLSWVLGGIFFSQLVWLGTVVDFACAVVHGGAVVDLRLRAVVRGLRVIARAQRCVQS